MQMAKLTKNSFKLHLYFSGALSFDQKEWKFSVLQNNHRCLKMLRAPNCILGIWLCKISPLGTQPIFLQTFKASFLIVLNCSI